MGGCFCTEQKLIISNYGKKNSIIGEFQNQTEKDEYKNKQTIQTNKTIDKRSNENERNMEQEKKEKDNTAINQTSEIKINNKNENEHKSSKEGKEERDAGVINRQCISGDPNFVPDQLIDILRESVCRIEIKKPRMISSGFFIKINLKIKEYKFLFTCNHSLPQKKIN